MGKHYRFKGVGLNKEESKRANKLFNEYKANYNIDSFSDLQLLEELVYRETKQDSYKRKLGELNKKLAEKETTANIIPKAVLNAFNENLQQILILKDKLGLFEEKKDEDAFKHIQTLKKKFKVWQKENQGSRTLLCPECGKVIMLRIRTDAWEAQKHSFFRDRILTNDHLLKMYKEGKILKEDVAKVLGVSDDYVDFILEKFYSPE